MPHRRLVLCMGLVLLCASVGSGCSSQPTKPQLHLRVTVGPRAHEAVLHVTETGSLGGAYSGVVLVYPDGHQKVLGTAIWGRGDLWGWPLSDLPSGVYSCRIYAVPYTPTEAETASGGTRRTIPFPVAEMTRKNLAASQTFVVP